MMSSRRGNGEGAADKVAVQQPFRLLKDIAQRLSYALTPALACAVFSSQVRSRRYAHYSTRLCCNLLSCQQGRLDVTLESKTVVPHVLMHLAGAVDWARGHCVGEAHAAHC
jgi:hypothetical protein